jgi:hypothetical protein
MSTPADPSHATLLRDAVRMRLALATTGVPTPGGQMPLADAARYQVELLGAADVVWKAATAAGQVDAAARTAQLLGTTASAPAPPQPVPLFADGPADPAEQVAARIWAAGTGLPPAQHARWFAHTWWPYHLTGTTRAFAAFLAARLGHQPPAHPPARGGPGRSLFTAIDRAARPERSSHDRFVAAYRIVDAAARPYTVQAATEAIRDHLTGADLAVDETTLTCAAVQAGDARRFAPPAIGGGAARRAHRCPVRRHRPPTGTGNQPAAAAVVASAVGGPRRRPPAGHPGRDAAGGRPGQPPAAAAGRRRCAAVQNARLPTPPPTRAASTTRRAPR